MLTFVRSSFSLFAGLSNPIFARLYLAQTINLLGDALTWVGLALLAYDLAGDNSAVVLSSALTLRVVTFVMVAPWAGVLADRVDRKLLLGIAHLARMGIIGLLPWVTQVWQLYGLVVGLNLFNALFTPTFKATIPLVTDRETYPQSIALTSATGQLLGILGPGIAGGIAAWLGLDQVFWLDALTFCLAALCIFSLPGQLRSPQATTSDWSQIWSDLWLGSQQLWRSPVLRYALGMQLVAAIVGAQILVNTVSYVQGYLHQGQVQYGWVMAAFGCGAMLAAISIGARRQQETYLHLLGIGALVLSTAIIPANHFGWITLMGLWALAGAGESCVNVPTQTLLADLIAPEYQGRVYGAHFAWSHLWWVFAYPLAGWLGHRQSLAAQLNAPEFFYGGLIAIAVLVVVRLSWLYFSNSHAQISR
jgi:NRE family putative nickel resistance protein-like MFS transporter